MVALVWACAIDAVTAHARNRVIASASPFLMNAPR